MYNGIIERIFLVSELFEGTNEGTLTHFSVMDEFPDDESFEGSPLTKPLISCGLYLFVIGNEYATCSRCVLKEHIIGGFLRECIYGSFHIPSSSTKTLH
jgi:hypothetical protein